MIILFSVILSNINLDFVSVIYYIFLLIGPVIGIGVAFSAHKNFLRTAEDSFQLLVKKPMIQMEMESKGIEVKVKSVQPEQINQNEDLFYPYCGEKTPPSARICENCGEKID